jgi:hypothetical protein
MAATAFCAVAQQVLQEGPLEFAYQLGQPTA